MDKILLLANTSYAGMGPYVASIVNSFEPEDEIFFYLVEDNDEYYSKNIKESLLPYCTFFKSRKNKFKTLMNLTIRPNSSYFQHLNKFIKKNDINCIHCLTSTHDVNLVKEFSKRGLYIMTIHDLTQHEHKKAFYKEFRENVLFKRMKRCLELSKYLVTNSASQFEVLKSQFKDKKIEKFPFPTLMTTIIKKGGKKCSELTGVKDYILFFGRIEEYKGLKLLIDAFLSINLNRKLVIAGKGDFVDKLEHPNIIYLNRYIYDEEIKDLYENAAYVVYPYISATQSGVLSIASYFKKPMIVSDLSFFKETIGDSECAVFFKAKDSESLANAMVKMEISDLTTMGNKSGQLYDSTYSEKNYKEYLLQIYSKLK